MLDRFFHLSENHSNVRTELLAGLTTFLTMAYIIVVQPMVLSGRMSGRLTGMDFDAVTTATCIAAALASAIMGLYGRYPIAQAPAWARTSSLSPWLPARRRSCRGRPDWAWSSTRAWSFCCFRRWGCARN